MIVPAIMNQNQRRNSDGLSTPPQQLIRSPASGYSKSILSAIKDIPYEALQQQQSSKITFKFEMEETKQKQIEKRPLDTPSPKAITVQYENDKPSTSSCSQQRERRSISCDTTITSLKNTPITRVDSDFQSKRAQSVYLTNVMTTASTLLLPGRPIASSKISSCVSIQSAASTTATTAIVDDYRKRSPSISSSICSKDEKNTANHLGQPKIHFSICVQALNACTNGELETLKKLIKENPDLINYQYPYCYRYSCLHIAAKAGNIDIINFLVMNGANLNAKDDTWSTPLHLCARSGHFDAIKQLKKLGAKTNLRDAHGKLYSSYLEKHNVECSKKSATMGRQMKIHNRHKAGLDPEQDIDSPGNSTISSNFSQYSLNTNASSRPHNYSFHSFRKPFTRAVQGLLHRK